MAYNTRIIHTNSSDPWWNLSVEEYLLERVEPGQCILYLWQNENTVVIGRNQNPWRECRTELLENEGGKLARRLSGGGAVFHDIGNLNFTFIANRDTYDMDKQLEVILGAVKALGIQAEKSGRNDLTVDGRKFSGNAFCFRKNNAYHHGTILVTADFDKLSKYLQVSDEKMNAKGVKSVQSRVVNLSELRPELTVADVADALITVFRADYESTAKVEHCIKDGSESQEVLEELYSKYSSWKWRYGEAPSFDVDISKRFAWGEVQIGFTLLEGIVSKAVIYSDALDEAYIARLSGIFDGCQFNSRLLAQRLHEEIGREIESLFASGMDAGLFGPDAQRNMTEDIVAWLEEKHF